MRRRRHRLCWSFTAYLATVLLGNILIAGWPEHFYNYRFWLFKESLYDLLKLAVGYELLVTVFRNFRGARSTGGLIVAAVLFLTVAALLLPVGSGVQPLASQLHPRVVNGTIWLFASIAVLAFWYQIPLHPMQRAILVGFLPYLFFSRLLSTRSN